MPPIPVLDVAVGIPTYHCLSPYAPRLCLLQSSGLPVGRQGQAPVREATLLFIPDLPSIGNSGHSRLSSLLSSNHNFHLCFVFTGEVSIEQGPDGKGILIVKNAVRLLLSLFTHLLLKEQKNNLRT